MSEIKWRRPGRVLSPDEINEVEKLLSCEFPEDYKTVAKLYHGCSVIPYCIDVNHVERVFGRLLPFEKNDDEFIIEIYESIKESLGEQVIPFAVDPSGNYFCFKYENDSSIVVFWNHEDNSIEFICNTFTDMLELLHK